MTAPIQDFAVAMQAEAYCLSPETVAARLGVNPALGLTTPEAGRRLAQAGLNELRGEQPVPAWRRFLAQFQDTLVVLLLVATGVSLGLWVYERDSALPYEALTILSIVLLNAVLGYVQGQRAEQAVAALKAMTAASARVLRDGQPGSVPTREVVPGDVLLLEEGDTIPADARLTQVVALRTLEASLTGESLPVSKSVPALTAGVVPGDQANMVFSGTVVAGGRGRAIVTSTGMRTQIGQIAGLLERTRREWTPLQRELDRVGKRLGVLVLVMAVIMTVTLLLLNDVRTLSGVLDILILGVALAVAAVPEGLPAITSVVLALGTQRMARRNAIVRHLPAVETLGCATVIASDKTGTLTRNEMTVRMVLTASGTAHFGGSGYDPHGEVCGPPGEALSAAQHAELQLTLTAAALANNAALQEQGGQWQVQGDPTEGALIVAARKLGLSVAALEGQFERVGELPFSSERKCMSTVQRDAQHPAGWTVFSKGAPDVLLRRCTAEWQAGKPVPLTEARRAELHTLNETLAAQALRTLGIATRILPPDGWHGDEDEAVLERDLTFLGLTGMLDPPRPEVQDAVQRTRLAGIRPLMITGDHPVTARAIAAELGLNPGGIPALTGAQLSQLSNAALDQAVQTTSVYARVNPEHKLRIVDALHRQGEVVAMTGDGVNDAPALKAADIGVAMGITGTDVSKEAADLILTDDNFASIVAAIEEGRSIFSNIQKFLRYLLSSNVGEVMTMFLGVILAGVLGLRAEPGEVVLPLLATQILWINLVTDGAPALALGLDKAAPGVMHRPPRPADQGVLTAQMWRGIFLVGLIVAVGTLAVLDASLPGGLIPGSGNLTYARTMAFTTLMFFQLFNVFNARSDTRSAFQGFFRNRWLWLALVLSLVLHVLVVNVSTLQKAFDTTALTLPDWLTCVLVASTVLWGREAQKAWSRTWSGSIADGTGRRS